MSACSRTSSSTSTAATPITRPPSLMHTPGPSPIPLNGSPLPSTPSLRDLAADYLHQTVILNPWIPPAIKAGLTGRQAEFLMFLGRDALYGGAAGGGKSVALLIAALQYVTEPGYSALILRRT